MAPRDFGDPADYGSGGSDLEYHGVGDRDAVKRPNPLDDVVHVEDGASMPPAGPHAADRLTDQDRTPGSGALPSDKDGDADAGVG